MKAFCHLIPFICIPLAGIAPNTVAAAECSPASGILLSPRIDPDYAQKAAGMRISPWALNSDSGLLRCGVNAQNSAWALLTYLNMNKPAIPGMALSENGVNYPVYQTSVPGIGVVVGMQNHCDSAWRPLQPNTAHPGLQLTASGECTFPRTANVAGAAVQEHPPGPANLLSRASLQIAFVKTGSISGNTIDLSNLLSATGLIYRRSANNLWQYDSASAPYPVSAQSSTLTASCKIILPDNGTVNLPPIPMSDLAQIGSTAGTTPFKILIQCSHVSAVTSFRFSTLDNGASGNETLLANNAPNGAQGVAVRLLDGNQEGHKPVLLDTYNPLPPQIGNVKYHGQTALAFYAQYYRTQISPYSAGKVKAQTVFDIIYH